MSSNVFQHVAGLREIAAFIRSDWKENVSAIQHRPDALTTINGDYVGLEDMPATLVEPFEMDRDGRPTVMMFNASSGSGKSAAVQFCEHQINQNSRFGECTWAILDGRHVFFPVFSNKRFNFPQPCDAFEDIR